VFVAVHKAPCYFVDFVRISGTRYALPCHPCFAHNYYYVKCGFSGSTISPSPTLLFCMFVVSFCPISGSVCRLDHYDIYVCLRDAGGGSADRFCVHECGCSNYTLSLLVSRRNIVDNLFFGMQNKLLFILEVRKLFLSLW